jgi:3,4-dihydroxy 2-butanone 4-phosphate synthase
VSLLLEPRLHEALAHLRAGKPVLVYDADGREGETDLFFAAHLASPDTLHALRRDAGGLVFLAVDEAIATRFGFPFLQDLYAHGAGRFPVLRALQAGKLPYDARSSFSLTLNHRGTFTGITDNDRALTVRRFAELAAQIQGLDSGEARERLGAEFRTPGHVALCVASEPLLEARRGHTELGVALALMASIPPVLVGAEMLGHGVALPKPDAQAWARARGAVLLEGDEVAEAWASFIAQRAVGRA